MKGFEYTIAAIPTMYAGVQFRSRLEARWAAFFDLCKWKWDYEPLDMNGWIPDFILHGVSRKVLVEVKPVYELCTATVEKIAAAGGHSVGSILLGVGPFELTTAFHTCYTSAPVLGWLIEETEEPKLYTDEAVFGDRSRWLDTPATGFDFCSANMGFDGRLTGAYNGGGHFVGVTVQQTQDMWRQAGNEVQWKKPA